MVDKIDTEPNESRVALTSVVLYDIIKSECKELAPLPSPVSEMATVKWGDDNVIIIIMGGADNESKPLKNVLMCNIPTSRPGRVACYLI